MDPFPKDSYPHQLPILSNFEELMISCEYIVMVVYALKGNNQIGYRGNCLNLEQDIDKQLCQVNILPRRPDHIHIILIRPTMMDLAGFKELEVNYDNILTWLIF